MNSPGGVLSHLLLVCLLLCACACNEGSGDAPRADRPAPGEDATDAPPGPDAGRVPDAAEQQLIGRAVRAIQEERYLEARLALEELLAWDPPLPSVQYIAGHAAYELTAYGEAAERLADAVAREPSLWGSSSALGFALHKLGRYDAAATAFAGVVAADAEAYKAHYGRGLVDLSRGEPAVARIHLERALAIEPSYLKARYAWGRLLEQEGDLQQARVVVSAVLDEWPSHEQAYYLLERILLQLGLDDDADEVEARRQLVYATRERIDGITQRLRAGEQRPELHRAIATAYADMGDVRMALQALRAGLAVFPDDLGLQGLARRLQSASEDDGDAGKSDSAPR